MTGSRLASILAAAGVLAAAACREPGCIELTRPAELLERPYPMGYLSTHPQPNRVVATLPPSRYQYRDVEIGKDYQSYELDTPRGRGYVIGEGITECR